MNLLQKISSGRFRQYRPNATSYYLYKSPLYVVRKTFNETTTHFSYPIPKKPPQNPITAMPTYSLPIIPTEQIVITRECNPMDFPDYYHYYTDGSCHPNPGIGAFGCAETAASYPTKHDATLPRIAIFIDNKTVLKFINFTAYPKYNCTRLLIQDILAMILDISILHPTYCLTFAKIKSHAGFTGNERIDSLVSRIAKRTRYIYGPNAVKKVTFPTALAMTMRHHNRKQYEEWHTRPHKDKMCYRENQNWNNKLTKLFQSLQREDASIMIQLISEHINLNSYYGRMNYDPSQDNSQDNSQNTQSENDNEDEDSKQQILNEMAWGAMGDSFYEYLLKFWIYTGKDPSSRYRRMYVEAVEGMAEHLWSFNTPSGLNYIAEWKGGRNDAKFDELACFTGGMLALGYLHGAGYTEEMNRKHLKMGEALGETCYQMFVRQKAGVSPEYVRFTDSGMQNGVDFYILRPETVETMMYLYRITKDEKWRNKGWQIYENIVRSTKVERGGTGYAPVLSVGHNPHHDSKGVMHSFFLAETLKYLYLLFSDDQVIPLDKFVFNTEAHPVLIPDDTFAPK
eukprot:89633_1